MIPRRRPARTRGRSRRWLLPVIVVLMLAGAAFWFGREVGLAENRATAELLARRNDELLTLHRTTEQALAEAEQARKDEAAAAAAKLALAEAKQPDPAMAELVGLAQARLAQGVPLDRLRTILSQVTKEPDCLPGIDRRRLTPRLQSASGPLQTVAFLDNQLTVGASASGEQFDPAKPVDVRIQRLGGGIEPVTGVLPMGHTLVADGRQYLFGFAYLEKTGQIEVALRSCAYP